MVTDENRWQAFAQQFGLNEEQKEKFHHYYRLLVEWNARINLTAITAEQDIIDYHFSDSLILSKYIDFARSNGVVDVGTGGGFPGIPLKIMYPQLPVFLVEVTAKKCAFLNLVIEQLGLSNCTVVQMDWRNFLRKTTYNVDVVCARASLRPDELTYMFKATSAYRKATLVYWASAEWKSSAREVPYFVKEELYITGMKRRKYVFFAIK